MVRTNTNSRGKRIALIVIMVLIATSFIGLKDVNALSVPTASGQINSDVGAILRAKASTSSKQLKVLKDNCKVTIKKEVFTSKTSTKKTKKWYQVKVSGKTGYVRSDLIDNIKYSSVTGKTTDCLNYRVGACEKMKKKGTFNKGTKIKIVLKANLKGKSTIWYKIKVGAKYYYVSSDYVKLVSSSTKTTSKLTISTSGIVSPVIIKEGNGFNISGKITSNKIIQKVVVGAVNSAGKWKLKQTATVNAKTFNIATVDSKVKFGKLSAGKYKYRVDAYVGGKSYTKVSKSFTVTNATGATLLANTAKALAWPLGTDPEKYAYSGGEPTDAYKQALDQAYPEHMSWSGAPNVGASCDVFIGTVCVYSGYDTSMHRGLNNQWDDLEDTTKWKRVDYSYNENQLENGDIIIYKKTNDSKHICMYVTIDGEGYIAEASLAARYGFINTSLTKILKSSDKKTLYVYRAVS